MKSTNWLKQVLFILKPAQKKQALFLKIIIIILSLLLSLMQTQPLLAAEPNNDWPTVLIKESPLAVAPETEFTLTVAVSEVNDLWGAGFDLKYDPAVIEYVGAEAGDFLNQDGCGAMFNARPMPGQIKVAANRMVLPPAPSGGRGPALPPAPPARGQRSPQLPAPTGGDQPPQLPAPTCPMGVSGSGSLAVLHFRALTQPGKSDLLFDFSDRGNGLKIWPAESPTFLTQPANWLNGEVTVLDTEAPQIEITAPQPTTTDQEIITYENIEPKIKIKAVLTDNIGLNQYSYKDLNGEHTFSIAPPAPLNLSIVQQAELTEGENEIMLTASDVNGNIATTSIKIFYIRPDITAPTVKINKPTTKPTYKLIAPNAQITLAGQAADDRSLARLIWENKTLTASGTINGLENWKAVNIPLKIGKNNIIITAYDEAGNSSFSSLVVEYKKPESSGAWILFRQAQQQNNNKGPINLPSTISHLPKTNKHKKTNNNSSSVNNINNENKTKKQVNKNKNQIKVLGIEYKYSKNENENISPTNKKNLLGGQEDEILTAYRDAFGKLPQTKAEWEDAERLAHGHWTRERNIARETEAKQIFEKIYLRQPAENNVYDQAAIMIIAYGLRPQPRNLGKEQTALKFYLAIFGQRPVSALDWNIIRAIAYSGATR